MLANTGLEDEDGEGEEDDEADKNRPSFGQ
jgi:hypothetical protein